MLSTLTLMGRALVGAARMALPGLRVMMSRTPFLECPGPIVCPGGTSWCVVGLEVCLDLAAVGGSAACCRILACEVDACPVLLERLRWAAVSGVLADLAGSVGRFTQFCCVGALQVCEPTAVLCEPLSKLLLGRLTAWVHIMHRLVY